MWNTTKKLLKRVPGLQKLVWQFRSKTGKPNSRHDLLLSLPKYSIGAEIGVHEGGFSERILAITRPTKLFLIDPWAYQKNQKYKNALYGGEKGHNQKHMDDRYTAVLERFSSNIDAGKIIVIRDASEKALQEMEKHSLDWVYIDGNHLYEYVKTDLELSFLVVRPGGVIAGDDYTAGGWWKGGVKRAVDEFVKEKNLRDVRILGNQFLIFKPGRSRKNSLACF